MSKPHDRDPYTGEDLGPIEKMPPRGEIEDTGYERTTPNPVYRGLPAATLVIHDGEIVAVRVTKKADLPEEEKARLVREQLTRQGRRKRKGPGDAPRPPKPEVRQVIDLMAALKKSLAGGSAAEVRDASLVKPDKDP